MGSKNNLDIIHVKNEDQQKTEFSYKHDEFSNLILSGNTNDLTISTTGIHSVETPDEMLAIGPGGTIIELELGAMYDQNINFGEEGKTATVKNITIDGIDNKVDLKAIMPERRLEDKKDDYKNIVVNGANNNMKLNSSLTYDYTVVGTNNNVSEDAIKSNKENYVKDKVVVIGSDNNEDAKSKNSTILGVKNTTKGEFENSFIVGQNNNINNVYDSNIMGSSSQINDANNSTTLGSTIVANSVINSSLICTNISGENIKNQMILGNNITSQYENNVILGNNSEDKQFVKVVNTTINGKLYDNNGKVFAGEPIGVVSVGGDGKERQIVNEAAGHITENSTDAVNGFQLFAVINEISKINSGSSKEESVSAGSTNLTVTQNELNETGGKNFVVDLSKNINLTEEGSLTIGGVSLSNTGLNNGGNKIVNVAEGTEDTDAVNVSQLNKKVTEINSNIAASKENVISTDKTVTINKTIDDATKATTFDLAVNIDNQTITKDAEGKLKAVTQNLENNEDGTIKDVAPENQTALVTTQTVANAINNSGFNIKTVGNLAEGNQAPSKLVKTGEILLLTQQMMMWNLKP